MGGGLASNIVLRMELGRVAMKRLAVVGTLLMLSACAATGRDERAGPATDWATVRCMAQPSGSIMDCVVVSESRPNLGLGDQAVQIVLGGRMTPETVKEMSEPSPFTATVHFQLSEPVSAP